MRCDVKSDVETHVFGWACGFDGFIQNRIGCLKTCPAGWGLEGYVVIELEVEE
jgi:hypothetical protein